MNKRRGFQTNSPSSLNRLKFVLLALPALFWSSVFLALAGVGPLESMLERVPELAQMTVALASPLMGAVLGVRAAAEARRKRAVEDDAVWCWATVATGAALFVFASLISLGGL